MNSMRLALLLIAGTWWLTGCQTSTIPVGSGSDRYELRRHLDHYDVLINHDIDHTYRAVLKGLDDLGLKPTRQEVDKLSGVAEGTLATGEAYSLKLTWHGDKMTEMAIRVGAFGDRALTLRLFDAVRHRL
jgi:hypothetical protein